MNEDVSDDSFSREPRDSRKSKDAKHKFPRTSQRSSSSSRSSIDELQLDTPFPACASAEVYRQTSSEQLEKPAEQLEKPAVGRCGSQSIELVDDSAREAIKSRFELAKRGTTSTTLYTVDEDRARSPIRPTASSLEGLRSTAPWADFLSELQDTLGRIREFHLREVRELKAEAQRQGGAGGHSQPRSRQPSIEPVERDQHSAGEAPAKEGSEPTEGASSKARPLPIEARRRSSLALPDPVRMRRGSPTSPTHSAASTPHARAFNVEGSYDGSAEEHRTSSRREYDGTTSQACSEVAHLGSGSQAEEYNQAASMNEKPSVNEKPTEDSDGKSKTGRVAGSIDDGPSTHHGRVELEVASIWRKNTNFTSARTQDELEMVSPTSRKKPPLQRSRSQTIRTVAVHWIFEIMMKRFVAHPSSKRRLLWDCAGILFLAYDLVMIPLVAFQDYIQFDSSEAVLMAMISAMYWALDMVSSFFVGYHTEACVEMHPKKIAIHYIKGWLLIDALLVSLDFSFLFMGLSQNVSFMRIGKTFSRGMRVLRLLRIVKMHGIVTTLMERIRSEHVRTSLVIAGQVFVIVMVNHFSACGFYGLSYAVDEHVDNWRMFYFTTREHDKFWYRYFTAMHWSLTQFTPASMEVTPRNMEERAYSVFVLLFALVTFSSFVSSITQAMTHLRELNAQRLVQESVLRRYLNEHGISTQLVNRVWHFLHQHEIMRASSIKTKEQEVKALELLPNSMRNELRWESYAPQLRRHPFFFFYSETDPSAMRQICGRAITEKTLLMKQELFSDGAGELTHMIFVEQGELEYYTPCGCARRANLAKMDAEKEGSDEEDSDTILERNTENNTGNRVWYPSQRHRDENESQPRGRSGSSCGSIRGASRGSGSFLSAAGASFLQLGTANISSEDVTQHKEPQIHNKNADHIKAGQWACEAALWAKKVPLCSPFVASEKSEVLIVDTHAFREVIIRHEVSLRQVALYGNSYCDYIGEMCNCKWRMAISNDYSIVEDLVHKQFDYTKARPFNRRSWSVRMKDGPLNTPKKKILEGISRFTIHRSNTRGSNESLELSTVGAQSETGSLASAPAARGSRWGRISRISIMGSNDGGETGSRRASRSSVRGIRSAS